MRKRIFDLINPIFPCYAIGEHKGKCLSPYVVLKFDNQLASVSNSHCGWQLFTLFLYAPLGDITVLDDMVEPIKNAMGEFEFTGEISPEQIEESKEAYFKILKFRIPKEVK
ncbi:TPA: hypothetical protein ACOTG0_002101 [Clostridium perfringens]|nr:hypothetical protein phiCPD_00014 [Clostridium phage phiCp-D]